MNRAAFLDRDGVLIEDVHVLTRPDQVRVFPGVPAGLVRLREAGYRLVVVSNQAVVARGLATEAEVRSVNEEIQRRLVAAGAPPVERFYFCPHHPEATLEAYRRVCDCRKPKPGMLLAAARDLGLDLGTSVLLGDRLSDIAAGASAGTRTVLLETGMHTQPLIVTDTPMDASIRPDHCCADFGAAVDWILQSR